MKKIYAVIEFTGKGYKTLRMAYNKDELIEYRDSFPPEERRKMWIAEKEVEEENEQAAFRKAV